MICPECKANNTVKTGDNFCSACGVPLGKLMQKSLSLAVREMVTGLGLSCTVSESYRNGSGEQCKLTVFRGTAEVSMLIASRWPGDLVIWNDNCVPLTEASLFRELWERSTPAVKQENDLFKISNALHQGIEAKCTALHNGGDQVVRVDFWNGVKLGLCFRYKGSQLNIGYKEPATMENVYKALLLNAVETLGDIRETIEKKELET